MSIVDLAKFLGTWGLIGSAAITLYLVVVWKTGALATVRDESGEMRSSLGAVGILTAVGSLALQIVLLVVADSRGISIPFAEIGFARLWSINYFVFVLWVLYDTFVIDILVVVIWHPGFLDLPDSEAHGSVAYHLRTIPKGMVSGVLVSLVATAIAWFVFPG